jgi:hypothetical protein
VELRLLAPRPINQAKDDWRNQRFPEVPDDSEERIPLPIGGPKTVSYP